jgi:hypothetical protein
METGVKGEMKKGFVALFFVFDCSRHLNMTGWFIGFAYYFLEVSYLAISISLNMKRMAIALIRVICSHEQVTVSATIGQMVYMANTARMSIPMMT